MRHLSRLTSMQASSSCRLPLLAPISGQVIPCTILMTLISSCATLFVTSIFSFLLWSAIQPDISPIDSLSFWIHRK